MAVDLQFAPKTKRLAGERCCEPVVYPDVEREQATRIAAVAKALGDSIRLQLVDVLRKHAGKVCVCELVPLSSPTLSHGRPASPTPWAVGHYYVRPVALKELTVCRRSEATPDRGPT